MTHDSGLRPIERRMMRLADQGVGEVEIAWRFRRSPRFVRQVLDLAAVPRNGGTNAAGPGPRERLRPLERRVLWWRDQGLDHEQLAPRFRRGPDFLRQVEKLARYKLSA